MSFSLPDAVNQFYREFPERKKDTYFPGIAENPGRKIKGRLLAAFARSKFFHFVFRKIYKMAGPFVAGIGPNLVILDFAKPAPSLHETVLAATRPRTAQDAALPQARFPEGRAAANDDYWRAHIFDHECGHVHNGERDLARKTPHMDECFADAYACLRHVQRFGAETGFLEAVLQFRSRNLPDMQNAYKRLHFTVASIQAVLEMKSADIAALSPQQTVDAAAGIAQETAFNTLALKDFAALSAQTAGKDLDALGPWYAEMAIDNRLPPKIVAAWLDSAKTLYDMSPAAGQRLSRLFQAVASKDRQAVQAVRAETLDGAQPGPCIRGSSLRERKL